MTTQLFEKYLRYLIAETNKYLSESNLRGDQLLMVANEVEKLKGRVAESNLPFRIKEQIAELNYSYSAKKADRQAFWSFMSSNPFSLSGIIRRNKDQEEMRDQLTGLRRQLNEILVEYLYSE